MRADQSSGVSRAAAIAVVLVALAIVALVLAPVARGGTYVAVQCHPTYNPGAANAIFSRSSDHYVPGVNCGSGAGLQIHNDADVTKGGRWASWAWYPPAGTTFSQIATQAHVGHGSGHKGYFNIGDATGNTHWRWPREGIWDAADWAAGSDAVAFTAVLACFAAPDGHCGRAPGAHTHVRRLWFTFRDPHTPSLALGGSLLEPGPRQGPQALSLSSADSGGGVWRWRVRVNGVQAASAEQPCDLAPGANAVRSFVPCPLTAAQTFSLDTEAAPFQDGTNEVIACVTDIGWPPNEACASRQVTVDNGCRSSGSSAAREIEAAFANGRAAATVASNRRATVRGRVIGRGGQAVAGAIICVFSEVAAQDERLEDLAQADRAGRFSFAVPRGPSRRLRLAHRHGSHLVERALELRVRARPRLKAGPRSRLHNGDLARFRGKLPGPGAAGRVVVLQAWVGGRWQAFKTAQTGDEGRFRARYRFRETTARRLYRFRAVVREQAGYPYLKGASPVRRVLVSP